MAAKPTDFHDPEKEPKEYIIITIDPGNGIDAVNCCKCVEESFCRLESNAGSFRAYAWGTVVAYVQTN